MTGYTGFNESDPTEQEGNFIALNLTPKQGWPEKLTVELVGGKHGAVTLAKNDPEVVLQVSSKTTAVKVTATNNGKSTVKTYSLSGLTLSPKA